MPLLALLASDSEMVPVGAMERVVRETRADVGELIHEPRRGFGHALHVLAVARVQDAAGNEIADLPAVLRHFRTLAQHLGRDA